MTEEVKNSANGAGVLVVENDYDDEITKAWSAVDYWSGEFGLLSEQRDKLVDKLGKAREDVKRVEQAIKDLSNTETALSKNVTAAKAALTGLSKEYPELAAEVEARRTRGAEQEIRELEDRLRQLKGK